MPQGAFQVPRGLGVVVGALPAGSVTTGNPKPSESNVVHDHIRLRQRKIAAIACIGVGVRTWNMKHAGTTGSGETVRSSAGSGQLGPGGCSTEMISDGSPDADRKVLVKGVGENLLPTAQARGPG